VILIHRFGSASLTGTAPDTSDPDNHQARDDFAPLRERLATDLAPAPRVVYFSYGAARELAQGSDPARGWDGDSPWDEHEPVYGAADTTDIPLAGQAAALGWLVRELRRCSPDATIDLVGYSTGGIVALIWAAAEADAPDDVLAAVHRLVLVSSPVGGINQALRARLTEIAPDDVARFAVHGTVVRELLAGSPLIRGLGASLQHLDVRFAENLRDQFINGAPLPPGLVTDLELPSADPCAPSTSATFIAAAPPNTASARLGSTASTPWPTYSRSRSSA
jgi:pimeloyl-ACP methyl ester carboxylesterase